MADYRLFFLGSDGAIEARHDFAATDDDAALQVMAVIGMASADVHHGVMLWQGTRRIFEIDDAALRGGGTEREKRVLGTPSAAQLSAEMQQCVLDSEETLLKSHWRVAKSRTLREATAELRCLWTEGPAAKAT